MALKDDFRDYNPKIIKKNHNLKIYSQRVLEFSNILYMRIGALKLEDNLMLWDALYVWMVV